MKEADLERLYEELKGKVSKNTLKKDNKKLDMEYHEALIFYSNAPSALKALSNLITMVTAASVSRPDPSSIEGIHTKKTTRRSRKGSRNSRDIEELLIKRGL